MIYSITVKLPKSKIQQYDMPGPVSVNDLTDAEFQTLIQSKSSHVTLAKELSNLKVGLKQVFWETLSPQKLDWIINYYSSNPLYFADTNTTPGENGTVSQKDGGAIERNNKVPRLQNSNKAYVALRINPIPYARYLGNNYFIPNYEINPLYKVAFQNPDPATFDLILNDLIEKNILPFPLGDKKYRKKPDPYLFNNVWYKLPDYNTLKRNADLLAIFNKYVTVQPVKLFTEDINAWINFLGTLPEEYHSADYYDAYISRFLPKQFSPLKGTQGKEVPVFEYDDQLYFVPAYDTFSKFEELKDKWIEIIVENRPIQNSKADEAFRQLEVEYPFQELNDYGLTYEQQFDCKKDPRWNKFINEKYLKIPENATEEQIEEMEREIRIKSPKLFLFSSIKPIKVEVIDRDGKKKHCFNLSNEYFENVPDGTWKRCMSALKNDPCKIYEFAIWCDSLNPEVWKGESRTPTQKGDIRISYFEFLHDRGMDESAYSIDAVLIDENKRIKYIIEFDGTDHFYSKRSEGNPTGKIVSDQVKNRFAREHNIPCIRIPGFHDKDVNFISDFKKYVINLIRQSYDLSSLQQESETTKPAIREVPAYKIRKMIK
jgi:hypothetical protein